MWKVGIDTFRKISSIPVDFIRGDYISAILSAIGAIPVAGEFADAGKYVKKLNNMLDSAKVADSIKNQ